MEIEKSAHLIMLYDFYGQLLTSKQKDYLELYYEQDLTLSEISEELSVSRQAVYDNIKRSESLLEKYESQLKMVEQFKNRNRLYYKLESYLKTKNVIDENIIKLLDELRREEL